MLKEIVCEKILDAIAEIAMVSVVSEAITGSTMPENFSDVLLLMAQAYNEVGSSNLRGMEIVDEAMTFARNEVADLLSTGHDLSDILKGL